MKASFRVSFDSPPLFIGTFPLNPVRYTISAVDILTVYA